MWMRSAMAVMALALSLAACGEPRPSSSAQPESSTEASPAEEPREDMPLQGPPPVTIRYFDQSAELQPWSFCYQNGCADGSPPGNLVDVGSPEEVFVEFPLPGWSFTAYFTPAGERCGRTQEVELEETGDGRIVLSLAGYAGSYDVDLFGRGGGDLSVTFRWTTPADGPLPEPEARLAVLAGHDGEVDSYGVELMLSNLATTPEESSATIAVRSEDGEEITFEAKAAGGGCWPEGTLYWDGPDAEGLEAATLGEGPFRYEVEVFLDGERYSATATWPDDEIRGNEPSVALDFEPPLPALS